MLGTGSLENKQDVNRTKQHAPPVRPVSVPRLVSSAKTMTDSSLSTWRSSRRRQRSTSSLPPISEEGESSTTSDASYMKRNDASPAGSRLTDQSAQQACSSNPIVGESPRSAGKGPGREGRRAWDGVEARREKRQARKEDARAKATRIGKATHLD